MDIIQSKGIFLKNFYYEDINRIYSFSQEGIMFIWKYINEKSDEY